MSLQIIINILDAHVPLKKTTELERAGKDIPDAIVDLFEAGILARTNDGKIDPVMVPTDASLGTDVSGFKKIGILQRGHLLSGWGVAIGRGFEINGFIWPLAVKLLAETVELTLLTGQIRCRRAGGFRFPRTMHSLATTILLGFARFNELRQYAEPHPHG
jgi:hypothetical protein